MSDAEDSELRPANDNPWYRLATWYGEQMKGANCWTWDKELAAKNRMAWNRWMARVLSDEQRTTLVGKGLPEQETPAETSALRSAFASGRISPTSTHSGPPALPCRRRSVALRARDAGETGPAGIPKIVRCLSCNYV